jgi:prolipoprotein diacylglyceryltransferase
MKHILPIAAMLCTGLTTLTAIVFCMAMGANSTPAQLRALKLWMGGLSLLGVAGVVVGILLIRAGQPNWAAVAAFAPTVFYGIIFSISLLK